jgi:tetratricopeptide (TPR) repeat protein
MKSFAWILYRQRQYSEAEDICRPQLERLQASLGGEHPVVIKIRQVLANCLAHRGRFIESEAILQTLLAQSSGPIECYRDMLYVAEDLGDILKGNGRFLEATTLTERAYQGLLRLFGPEFPGTVDACFSLGDCYEIQGKFKDALKLYQEQMEGSERLQVTTFQLLSRYKDGSRG